MCKSEVGSPEWEAVDQHPVLNAHCVMIK